MKVTCEKAKIDKIIPIVTNGGIIIFPTDTVYGIGCNPYNRKSVKKIYQIKSRDKKKPLPILAYSKEIAEKIVEFDELAERIVKRFWPGQLTVISKIKDEELKKSLGLKEKVAVRVPDHSCTLALLKKCDFLVGTSANVSGHPSFTDPNECIKHMHNYDIFVDGGNIKSKGESTIIETRDNGFIMIREGSLKYEEISQA